MDFVIFIFIFMLVWGMGFVYGHYLGWCAHRRWMNEHLFAAMTKTLKGFEQNGTQHECDNKSK